MTVNQATINQRMQSAKTLGRPLLVALLAGIALSSSFSLAAPPVTTLAYDANGNTTKITDTSLIVVPPNNTTPLID